MIRKLGLAAISAAFLCSTASAQENASCSLPGEPVMEDALGDHLLAPTGEGFADIHTLHMAEPGGGPQLVFTYKMADLALLPPNTLWIIRFLTDILPAGGATEYFVAMLTGPDSTPHFVYGTAGPADGPGGAAPLLFTPAGPLEAGSGFKADGTITLALDKSVIPGLEPGGFVFGMIPLTHRITPTDGAQPFVYGFRSVSDALLAYDDAPDGFYEVIGNEGCGDGKLSLLGAGGLGLPALLALAGFAALRRQRRHND